MWHFVQIAQEALVAIIATDTTLSLISYFYSGIIPTDSMMFKSMMFKSMMFKSMMFKSMMFKSMMFKSMMFKSMMFKSMMFKSMMFKGMMLWCLRVDFMDGRKVNEIC